MSELAIGLYDDLDDQTQPVLTVDPEKENIMLIGGHSSGKTCFIKTLLVRLHESLYEDRERDIFILDLGNNLGRYRELNTVAACFDSSNEENVRRVFRTVESKLEKNTKILNSRRFSEVWEGSDPVKPAQMILVIDNLNSFLADDRFGPYHELLTKFCRDGLSKGLSVIITAADLSGGVNRLIGHFTRRFALEGSADKYLDIFGMRISEPMHCPGRGVTVLNGKPREFQFFLPFMDEDNDLPMFKEALRDIRVPTEKLTAFDGDLTESNFFEYLSGSFEDETSADCPVVGLDYYDHFPVTVNMHEAHSIAIYGKKHFGKTNLLTLLVRFIRKNHPDYRIVFFDDGRKQLLDLYNENSSGCVYLTSTDEMYSFLDSYGYAAKLERGVINKSFEEKKNPPTVFVLQNKMLFQSAGAQLLKNVFPRMTAAAEEKSYWFIYSDVRRISNNDRDTESSLNNSISVAFLLDNIAEFVSDRGSRSVFGEMDPRELKNEYARCELGDGYYYDIESDELKKIKFIKV
ncbi:MAG: hypothetical protein IJ746_04680 [Ruminococcus sp.]|nr:hypothetical protein [Ruminococcus sp.]